MDDKTTNNQPQNANENWLDDLLPPTEHPELEADDHAMNAAGLKDPVIPSLDDTLLSLPEDMAEQLPPAEDSPVNLPAEGEVFRDAEYRDAFGKDGEELEAVFNDASESEQKNEEEPPIRKKRPKWRSKYGLFGIPHILVTFVWIAIVMLIGVTLGRIIWLSASDVLAFGREDQKITITVTQQDNIDTIAEKLHNAGLVRYPELFKLYADLSNAEEKISVGSFTLNTLYDYNALVNSMRIYSSSRQEVKVMVPEGYSCAQIFRLLEENDVCSVADLEEAAANAELDDYWFLEGVQRGDRYCLEGYLFPDTYRFYKHDDPKRVLEKFLDAFDYRYTDLMKSRIEELNAHLAEVMSDNGYDEEYIAEHQITIREVVIIASLIQKEAANVDEFYEISSVIYNRLYDWDDTPPFLNLDAAIIYALDGNIDPETGDTIPLTSEDLQLDHPYNTYIHTGLTPGPITNPGTDALNAALVPDDTNFYYYALDPESGTHHFSSSYDEHQNFLNSIGG